MRMIITVANLKALKYKTEILKQEIAIIKSQ